MLEIFQNALPKYETQLPKLRRCCQRKAREVYLFDLGPDNGSWEQMKKKYRYGLSTSLSLSTLCIHSFDAYASTRPAQSPRYKCDQYRWVTKGCILLLFQEDSLSSLRTTLLWNITLDGRMYVLVGYTLCKKGASHFIAAVMWRVP